MSSRAPKLLVLLPLLVGSVFAGDPVPPPGGFKVKVSLKTVMTWSDSYRTYLDTMWPDFATPNTGWPVFLVIHGGGGSRNKSWVKKTQLMMAKRGYVALAYDVRGEGDTGQLNSPNDGGSGSRKLTDMSDCFYEVERLQPTLVDDTRITVYGQSLGGTHAFWAAAYSQQITLERGYTLKLPKISAAISDIECMDTAEDRVPQSMFFQAHRMLALFKRKGPNPLLPKFLANDPAGFLALWKSDPASWYFPLLQKSSVPLLVMNSYDDEHHVVNNNPDSMKLLKAGVPRRFYLKTGGHGSQYNEVENAYAYDHVGRWSDRFLKGGGACRDQGSCIDREPFAEVAVMPADTATYGNGKSHWQHRMSRVWPPTFAKTRRYLRGNGKLTAAPPTGTEPAGTLRHRTNGYTALQFLKDDGDPLKVFPKIPFVFLNFDMAPFQSETELFGRSELEVEAYWQPSQSGKECQYAVSLWDVNPEGFPRYITSGMSGKRNITAGRHRIKIVISDVAYVFPAGHRLRLSLENLCMRHQAGHMHFLTVPEFNDYDITLLVDTKFPPRVDLPLREPQASLTPRFARVSAGQGIDFGLLVEGETFRAGDFYLIVMGGSGITPGLNFPPLLPINVDQWTFLELSMLNTPVFASFAGLLSTLGQAQGRFVVPLPIAKALAGTRFDFAVLGMNASGIFTSAPATLVIDP